MIETLLRQFWHAAQTQVAGIPTLCIWLIAAAAVFVPLERLLALRRQVVLRACMRQDLALYFLGGVIPPIVAAVFGSLSLTLGRQFLPSGYFSWLADWPVALQVGVVVLLSDVTYYWAHRLSHEIPWLWRFHVVHHSPTQLDWLVNTRAHPLDLVFAHVFSGIPLLFFGLQLPSSPQTHTLILALVVWQTSWAFFIHSNVRLRLGWLEQVLTTPAFHHWHHANDDPTVLNKNYAAALPFLDRIFGSHLLPDRMPRSYGSDQPVPEGIRAVLWYPFARSSAPRPASSDQA